MGAMNSETVNLLTRMLHDEWEGSARLQREIESAKRETDQVMDFVQELKDERDELNKQVEFLLRRSDDLVRQNERLAIVNDRKDPAEWNPTSAKIAFIKLIREKSGAGLIESKRWVDEFIADHTITPLD